MTTTSVDQILQISVPARSATDPPKSAPADGAQFQEHLQRASSVEEKNNAVEPQKTQTANETSVGSEDEEVALTTEQEQDSSLEQNEVNSPALEGEEQDVQPAVEVESLLNADDLLISTAAVIAVESTEISETPIVAEVESTVVIQPTTAEEDFEESAEPEPFVAEKTEQVTDEIVAVEVPVDGEQKVLAATTEPSTPTATVDEHADTAIDRTVTVIGPTEIAVDPTEIAVEHTDTTVEQTGIVVEQTDQQTTIAPTNEVSSIDQVQQIPQTSQQNGDGEPADQDSTFLPGQQLVENNTPQQSPLLEEVDQNVADSESSDKKQENPTSRPVNQLASLEQEIAITSTEVEPTAATISATTVEVNTNSESLVSTERPTSTPSIDQSSITTEASTEETDTIPTIDRARFVQRVSGAIRSAKNQDGLVQIKLSPPELGSLRIIIRVEQGVLTAQLETETVAARNVLLDNLPALRDRLAEQEIRIEKFDVDVREESSQQQENPGAEDRRSSNTPTGNNSERASNGSEQHESSPINSDITSPDTDLSAGLDVMI